MRRVQVGLAVVTALVVAGVLVAARPLAARQQACLHGANEAPDQLARRQRAVGFTRHINTLQLAAHGQMQTYLPLDKLPVTETMPDGFAVHLVSDGANYAFSVKDTADPCRFGFFSDQSGLIYSGQAIR
jgi:hypothetical protein